MNISEVQGECLLRAQESCNAHDLDEALRLLERVRTDSDIRTGGEDVHPAWRSVWQQIKASEKVSLPDRMRKRIDEFIAVRTVVTDEGIWKVKLQEGERVLFLLGAGASKASPSNIPTVTELLPELWVRAAKVGREDLDKLAAWCQENAIHNIEDLLTAAYIANFCAKNRGIVGLLNYFLFHRDVDEEERLVSRRRRVVGTRADAATVVLFQETLQILFGLLTGTMISAGPNRAHKAIAKLGSQHVATTVLTTNYDGCIDEAVENTRTNWEFHIEGQPLPQGHIRPEIIKMHGSINWFFCDSCQEMTHGKLRAVRQVYEKNETGYPVIGICKACGGQRRPMIVPPLSIKFLMFPHLMSLWNRAPSALEDSKVIVAVGYSFSDADAYITNMVTRAMASNADRQLIIVDPDTSIASRLRGRFKAHIQDFDESRVMVAGADCVEIIPRLCSTLIGKQRKPVRARRLRRAVRKLPRKKPTKVVRAKK